MNAKPVDRYARYNHIESTKDSREAIWIACDESGQDGENLVSPGPVLSHGSVRLDDLQAQEAIAQIRDRLPPLQGKELKFRQLDNARGLQVLTWALSEGGPLWGRASIYLAHKPYVAVAKAIDLLVEEQAHAEGRDLYSAGQAREMARTIFREGPRAVGIENFTGLVASFVSLFREHLPPSAGAKETVDGFFDLVDALRLTARRRNVSDVLMAMHGARDHAVDFQERLDSEKRSVLPTLDPIIPCIVQSIRYWAEALPHVEIRALHDRINILSDERIDLLIAELRRPYGEFATLAGPVRLREITRGVSEHHPSLQLADVLAGAGRVAGEAALGLRPDDHPHHELASILTSSVDVHSLWGDESSWQRLKGLPSAR